MAIDIPHASAVGTLYAQARPMRAHLQAMFAGQQETSVISGCTVTANGTNLELTIAPGQVQFLGVDRFILSTKLTPTADATHPRMVLVSISPAGVGTLTAGTPAADTSASGPELPDLPAGHLALASVYVLANATTLTTATHVKEIRVEKPEYANFTMEPQVRGLQDIKRSRSLELRSWRAQLANREKAPSNLWLVGDSMTEAHGTTDDYKRWTWILRDAIQRPYRNGGVGFIPAKRVSSLYTANPDGKNHWSLQAGALVDNVDYGYGFGRRAAWLANGGTYEITVDCDRFWIAYTAGGTGNMRVTVDPGTAFETIANQATASGHAGIDSGRIYDSGAIRRGTHVIRVASTDASTVILDGIYVFDTDATVGVHVWEGGHSGHRADNYDGSAFADGYWADLGWQPYTPVSFTNGAITNGTNVFTSATASFTDRDIGEFIMVDNPLEIPFGSARIISRNSGTSVNLDRTAVATNAGTRKFRICRAEFTDGSITSGSNVLNSASGAQFNPWDEGKWIQGPAGIPAGTYIERYISATQVHMSKNATATAGSQTVRIVNRQARRCTPDLISVQFGYNEMPVGITPAAFKTNLANVVETAIARSGTGKARTTTEANSATFPNEPDPSVVITSIWAAASTVANYAQNITTTNGSALITSTDMFFGAEDVGKTITGTGIPGSTTILSVQDENNATLSANATASGTVVGTIADRLLTDRIWQKYRKAMYEVCEANRWAMFDLYSLAEYVGINDLQRLTMDLLHPSDRGSAWIADQMCEMLSGLQRIATISQGIFNQKGELIVARGADVAEILEPGVEGQVPTYKESAAGGFITADPGMLSAMKQAVANPTLATFSTFGAVAPTATSPSPAAASSDKTWGPAVRLSAATTSTEASLATLFTILRPAWIPEISFSFSVDATITTVRYWAGFFSGTPVASADPAVHAAAFRYDTVADTTAFWRTYTNDGTTTGLVKVTTIPFIASGRYDFRIESRGVRGTNATEWRFYNSDILVAVHTTELPGGSSNNLGWWIGDRPLAASARAIDINRVSWSHA